MTRALIIDAEAANRLTLGGDQQSGWLDELKPLPFGVHHVEREGMSYLIGENSRPDARLLVVSSTPAGIFAELPKSMRLECFHRVLRAALSQFSPGFVKIPLDWRIFHSGSLISFHSNRASSGVRARAYLDMRPDGSKHVYAFRICTDERDPLTRTGYDIDLFVDAVLNYEAARDHTLVLRGKEYDSGHATFELTDKFPDSNIALGIPFTTWRDTKLGRNQRKFFDEPFHGPLRVKGPAGSGKTLALVMRFLKEVYARLDRGEHVRACFLAHAEETSQNILNYLRQVDERGLFFMSEEDSKAYLEVTTLHGLANQYINTDTQNVQPLSLDGTSGRQLQLELLESIVTSYAREDFTEGDKGSCRTEFIQGLVAPPATPAHKAFCFDLSDEFASVLETFGVRGLDEIGRRYLRARPSERALGRNADEKRVILELYRRFRKNLADMGVVSLDQFTADFLAFLNSFRWEALRRDKGFDFAFADELHLFNAQERRVLGYLLRDREPPRRVAVAYDPKQSPRNTFFPQSANERDTIWSEAQLESPTKPFELDDVFRYTPQILAFLSRLNQQFPATDLAEDWALSFGRSVVSPGPIPMAFEGMTQLVMVEAVVSRAKTLARQEGSGNHVAVLCLDHDRFSQYQKASRFQDDFVVIAGRDELGAAGRFHRRIVLSMPEYVAGLQFKSVLLVDANASLVAELGGAVNGLHRFISAVYLGASRAKHVLEIFADRSEGGFAEPIRDALAQGVILRT